ncbi:MAG: AAA family ATPase, partial [Rivularia sp. (in: cyanobacteria)]
MNQPSPDNNQTPINNSDITQRVEGGSTVEGGILANQGNKNVQVHGEGNVVTYNQTEILQISREEITSRKLITTSPYKGLKAFESRDKELFFGRDNFITTLVNELEHTNLVLVLGASGSGKSSVVRAGLIPWLEKKYGTKFTNLTFTPDADPFDSFYASLLSKYSQAEAKIAREVKAETLVQVANNLKQSDEFWFIFIDQFEELFTISDENKRREFISGLMQLSKAKLPNLKIIATMRADFLERLSDFPQLVEATQKHRPMIVEMQSSELRLAIEQPAVHHGVVFQADLVDKIIAEVKGQAGCLPLLQYTLNLLWEDEVKTGSINDRILNIDTYQGLGGVKGALQQHVNSIYEKLSSSEKFASQRICLKLVGIGENAESGIEWKPVRRRAMLSEFADDERDVLLKLVNENLLVSNADLSVNPEKKSLFGFSKPETSNSTIEITHEILLTSWDKLHHWIQKNRQGIALRNRLYEDVKRWKEKKPEDELWTGSKLEQILELRKDDNFNQVLGGLNAEANHFIDASVGLRDRQLRRARIIAGVGFTLAGLASVASGFAFVQQQEALKQNIIGITQIAESRLLENNQIDAIVEAIKAKKKLDNLWMGKDSVSVRVLGSLAGAVHHNQQYGLFRERLRLRGTDVIISPDGKLLATIDGNIIRLWDVESGKQLHLLKGHQDGVSQVVFSPDGKQLATASSDKTARLWDVESGKQLHLLKGHQRQVNNVVFSPDGKQLATASWDKTARLWDVESGKQLLQL